MPAQPVLASSPPSTKRSHRLAMRKYDHSQPRSQYKSPRRRWYSQRRPDSLLSRPRADSDCSARYRQSLRSNERRKSDRSPARRLLHEWLWKGSRTPNRRKTDRQLGSERRLRAPVDRLSSSPNKKGRHREAQCTRCHPLILPEWATKEY